MEGKHNLEMSLNFGGSANDVSYQPEDDPNQHIVVAARRSGNQSNVLYSPQWTHFQKEPHNYVEFLAENSTFLENASGADMLESITSPVGGTQSVDGLSETPREFLFNKAEKAFGYKHADSSHDMKSPHNEVQPASRSTNFQQQILSQNHSPWTQEPHEDNCNVSQLSPRVTVVPSFFLTKPRHTVSKQRAATTDRDLLALQLVWFTTSSLLWYILVFLNSCFLIQHRRMRIAERLVSLQELLPHSAEGSQAAILDDIIDHIKFLQLQIKELSQSRLGGQPSSQPFIFLEGYGHYILSEQMTNEPLEEMMGKLVEMNPAAATKLLESKGLYMRPVSLAEGPVKPS